MPFPVPLHDARHVTERECTMAENIVLHAVKDGAVDAVALLEKLMPESGHALFIAIDLDGPKAVSKSGLSETFATTRGNMRINVPSGASDTDDGVDLSLGVNLFRPLPESEISEEAKAARAEKKATQRPSAVKL